MSNITHNIDAGGKSLGRLASEVAVLLMGKMDPRFERHIASTDMVRVFNMSMVRITGNNKMGQKRYYRYSGYPGGLKETTLKTVMEKDPGEALRSAVYGMLPKNKLRALAMRRLFIYQKEIAY